MERYRAELGAGLRPEEVTFDHMADQYLAALKRTARPSTVTYSEWALAKARPLIGHVLVADIVRSNVEAVLHAVEDSGLSPRSVAAVRSQVRAVMQRAVEDRLVLSNPVDALRARRKPVAPRLALPPVEDVLALLDGLREAGSPSWPMLWVIASTGLRTGEARGLRWRDCDRVAGLIHVRGQMDRQGEWSEPKTSAGVRTVPIVPRVETALDEMQARQAGAKVRSVYVFASQSGRLPAPWSAHRAWSRAQERRWGKVRLTVHGLRHLALSVLVAQGVALPDVAAHAGHSDSRTLSAIYAHAMHDREERIAKALKAGGVG
jgi:integrase